MGVRIFIYICAHFFLNNKTMEIKLIKYSLEDNTVVFISNESVENISTIDCNGNEFFIDSYSSTQTPIGFVVSFSTQSSNLISEDNFLPDLSKISILKVYDSNADVIDIAVYDSSVFVLTKIDMLNAIKESGDSQFYKYLVKFIFLEFAMNDIAKYSGNTNDLLKFYDEMISIKDMFKAKYHYGRRI